MLDESGWVYYRTPAELKSDIGASSGGVDVSTVLDKVYPVGAIYMSVNSTNPKALFGGTWVQIKDRFLLAAGTIYKAGATGGEATHTLTESEMPSHKHAVYYPNAGAADHPRPATIRMARLTARIMRLAATRPALAATKRTTTCRRTCLCTCEADGVT